MVEEKGSLLEATAGLFEERADPFFIVSPFQTAPIISVQRPPGKEETHAQQYTSQVLFGD